jgi:integrase
VRVPHLSPTTLTVDEQRAVLRVTQVSLRDHLIVSLALGTGLRLAEIVGLDVGDVFAPDGTPRVRVRVRAAIAKGGRASDVFLPDRLVAKLQRLTLLSQTKLLHEVLTIPEQPLVIHRVALPVADRGHGDGESLARGRNGRAVGEWHRLGESTGHDTSRCSP